MDHESNKIKDWCWVCKNRDAVFSLVNSEDNRWECINCGKGFKNPVGKLRYMED